MIPFFFFGLFDGASETVEPQPQSPTLELVHGWIGDRRQTKEELEAERIRLGIIDAKKEVKRIVRLLTKKKTEDVKPLEVAKLKTHEYLVRQQLQEAQKAYEALLFKINSNAILQKIVEQQLLDEAIEQEAIRLAQEYAEAQRLEEERQRQIEENDIAYVMAMLACNT